jgi:N-acetylneuraminic acid mutarotase
VSSWYFETFMTKPFLLILAIVSVVAGTRAEELQPLPSPVTNNAVVGLRVEGHDLIYSLMGLGPAKNPASVTNAANALNVGYNKWTTIRSVPGSGRLGAAAAGVREQVFLIGGFVPDGTGLQAIVPDLSVYDALALRWYRGPDLPTPVRDAVVGVYRDRYIYVVGGFSKRGPTNEVQVYDTDAQRWLRATPYPGAAVFGHAGTVVGNSIIYVDGAKSSGAATGPRFVPSDECWIGKIDRHDPKKIQWSKLPPHPGTGRYRIAAGGSDQDNKAYFAGGSSSIYDYNGIDLEKKPAEPSPTVFAYNLKSRAWETITVANPNPTMDEHALIVSSEGLIVVGGIGKDQQVERSVRVLPKGK